MKRPEVAYRVRRVHIGGGLIRSVIAFRSNRRIILDERPAQRPDGFTAYELRIYGQQKRLTVGWSRW